MVHPAQPSRGKAAAASQPATCLCTAAGTGRWVGALSKGQCLTEIDIMAFSLPRLGGDANC